MDRTVITTIAANETRSGLQPLVGALRGHLHGAFLGFSLIALGGSTLTGQPGFGRTSAGLLNLMLLMVPLIGLTIGAQSLLSADRQDRTLDYLWLSLVLEKSSSANTWVRRSRWFCCSC